MEIIGLENHATIKTRNCSIQLGSAVFDTYVNIIIFTISKLWYLRQNACL